MKLSAISALGAVLIGLAGAATAQSGDSQQAIAAISTEGSSADTEGATSGVPAAPNWISLPLSGSETHPELKQIASELAITLGTYEAGETPAEIAARLAEEAADHAAALHREGRWSRARVIYPQLGGLLPDSASVMVVLEQMVGSPDGVTVQVRTLDVRLRKQGDSWRVADLASVGGEELSSPVELPPEAIAVLEDSRIALPDSARWDIMAGRVAPKLLQLMARLAEQTPYGVVTLVSGHPWEIFGTPRQSDHTKGQAVDIYRIGERLVVEDRTEDSLTRNIVTWLYAQPEVARIGSPWALDGFGGRSFTDALHQDHLHIAVAPDLSSSPLAPE